MSLFRKISQKSSCEFITSMEQKNSMMFSLQQQIGRLQSKRQKYDEQKEQLSKWKCSYQELLRDQQTRVSNNEQSNNISAKSICALRMQTQQLGNQLKQKMIILKEIKITNAQLVEHYNTKEDETNQLKFNWQQQANTSDAKKMELGRAQMHQDKVLEDVRRLKNQRDMVQTQISTIKEKSNKIRAYIRNLSREQCSLTQILAKTERQNSIINQNISQLNTLISMNNHHIKGKNNQCQKLQFHFTCMLLTKNKIENELKEKAKELLIKREKLKAFSKIHENAQYGLDRLTSLISQTGFEINCISSKNNEIREINGNLKQDLSICEKHCNNVIRINIMLENEIKELKARNQIVIFKLKQSNGDNQEQAKWDCIDTGDFQRQHRK